ncbi:ankyrin [Aspergillus ellipticus CBS 707.79]|uniref:Ankyrin n=1 Tax=Aspergillus ellipticus CBS 707.79 TaxID=1448320 RepID=A0A319D6H7_9EURO|nr:ankyrin [Aspergillus ellipticus CBS 707.79]
MATLLRLPPELLLLICRGLGELEDVLRLECTCRHLRAFLNVPRNFKAIVSDITSGFLLSHLDIDETIYSGIALLVEEIENLSRVNLSDIMCRWQAMKILGEDASIEAYHTALALVGDCPEEAAGQPLSWAVSQDHEAMVRLLLQKDIDVEEHDERGGIPLGIAAGKGSQAMVRLLLELGAPIDSQNSLGLTPLATAALRGQTPMMELLLNHGAKLDTVDSTGATPLAYAAWSCNESAFLWMLDWCCSHGRQDLCRMADADGVTPLHIACATPCNISLLQRLIDEGADIQYLTELEESPLMSLLRTSFPAVGAISARFMAIKPHKLPPEEMLERAKLLTTPKLLMTPTEAGKLPLHYAAQRSDPALIDYLVSRGDRRALNHKARHGITPLMIALDVGNEEGAECLLRYPDIEFQGREGMLTEMHLAVKYCTPRMISILASHQRSLLNMKDAKGRTPLSLAIQKRRLAHFELLLKEGADVRIATADGSDPLSCATEVEDGLPFYELLVDSDLVKVDAEANSPLHRAVLGLSVQKVRDQLASSETDVRAVNLVGDTALHVAVQNSNVNVVEAMVEALLTSEVSDSCTLAQIPNYGGKTALDLALERGRGPTIALLVQPKWNATTGLPHPPTEWIERWSDEEWYSDLQRILKQSRFNDPAYQLLLRKQWGSSVKVHRYTSGDYFDHTEGPSFLSIGIPADGVRSPVRRIIFTIVSHDQGWSNDNPMNLRTRGTYIGSRTWFDAVLERSRPAKIVAPFRKIVSNVHTCKTYRKHTVVWSLEDKSPGLADYLKDIQPGDFLHVFPRTDQRGWMNYIREMAIELFYEQEGKQE